MANSAPSGDGSSGGKSFISVGVAIVAIAVFLGWLATRERPEPVVVQEPNAPDTAADFGAGTATLIDASVLEESSEARGLVGQEIELRGVPVSTAMGPQLFWLQLPRGTPFLVKLDSALVARGTAVPNTGRVDLIGRVLTKDTNTIQAWTQAGVLQSDDQRAKAEFGSTYIEARRVQPAGN
jgi:hypothetical protein